MTTTADAAAADYEMYTVAGNAAVADAIEQIRAAAARPEVRNHADLVDAARPIIAKVTVTHPEVRDTEPRGHLADAINAISAAHGWVPSLDTRWEL